MFGLYDRWKRRREEKRKLDNQTYATLRMGSQPDNFMNGLIVGSITADSIPAGGGGMAQKIAEEKRDYDWGISSDRNDDPAPSHSGSSGHSSHHSDHSSSDASSSYSSSYDSGSSSYDSGSSSYDSGSSGGGSYD